MKRVRLFVLLLVLWFCTMETGFAQVQVEVDPIAYLLKGYSVHMGYLFQTSKVDAGVFGLEVPKSIHGNAAFTVKMGGFGLKWHYFGKSTGGFYAGIGTGYSGTKYSANGETRTVNSFSVGVEAGYRIEFQGTGFYICPWLGLDHDFGPKNIFVAGKSFKLGEITPFPTVHLGWKF